MTNGYMDDMTYQQRLCEDGVFYPLIFCGDDKDGFFVYMPIHDGNEDISVGFGASFLEAYKTAQTYLIKFRMQYGRFPKHINPYQIDLNENEYVVMIKIYP